MTGPGVAVVATAPSLAARAARACERRGIRVVHVAAAEPRDLADALDHAARRDDIAAVLLHAGAVEREPEFARACRAITPHLPVVFAHGGAPNADPYFEPWLDAIGVLAVAYLAEAADGLAVVRGVEPPVDASCLVVGPDAPSAAATAARVRAAGLDVHVRDGAAHDAFADLTHDLIVAVLPEPESADAAVDALVTARRRHPDLPALLVADGPPRWAAALRPALEPLGCTVIEGDVDPATGLRMLRRWARLRGRLAMGGARLRDAGRLRRALGQMRRPDAMPYGPEIQGELVGALGLPFPRTRRAAYLEDALIAAAELGYPVRLAAVHNAQGWEDPPSWSRARRSDDLLGDGEVSLASAQATLGRRAELCVAEEIDAEQTVEVVAERHPAYGVVAAVHSGGRSHRVVASVDADGVCRALGMPRGAPAGDAVVSALAAVVAGVETVGDLDGLAVVLDIGSGGYMARHVSARQRA